MPVQAKISTIYEAPPLALETVRCHAATGQTTPYLLCDPQVVAHKLARLKAAVPGVVAYYAMKANSDPRLLRQLQGLGVPFEIASIHELDMLTGLGVDPATVIFSNPIKPLSAIVEAIGRGVDVLVVDARDEIDKIVSVAPHAQLCLRLEISNAGSDWPLTGKFGATTGEAETLIQYCAEWGLNLTGLTFHVGSQCRNPDNWHGGIVHAKRLFLHMMDVGLRPRLLNLGGGFPIQHTRPMPGIETIGGRISEALAGLPEGIRVICEPGRYLVGDSAWMVTRVIGTATRKGQRWVYLDVGAFTGLTETLEGFDYELMCDRSGPLLPTTVAGPSCDTADVLFRNKPLPADLAAGDWVYIPNAGAYTACYASTFNGFPLPEMILLGDVLPVASR